MKPTNKTSDKVCDKVRALRAKDTKLDDIAETCGICVSTVKSILRGAVVMTLSDRREKAAARYALFLKLREQGYSFKDIGEKLGITKGAVTGIAQRGSQPNYEKERWRKDRHKARLSESMRVDKVEEEPSPRAKPTLTTLKWMRDYFTDQRTPNHAALSTVD